MSLPAPNLDDRSFQDLVDEAKLRLAGTCPEWTDHNVSDPGVMLIELFAGMVDQLLFRLNQVPDRLYLKFLELIDVQPFPAGSATVDVTFWLSTPRPQAVAIERGTQVATRRTATEPAVVFTVVTPREIRPCAVARVQVTAGGTSEDATDRALAGEPFACFGEPPAPGDAFELELTADVAGCAIRLELVCDSAYGKGVDPERPPLAWEANVDRKWQRCEWTDATAGLNRSGAIVVHVSASAEDDPDRADPTRLRCVVVPATDRPAYERSPRLGGLTAATIGGTTTAAHGELYEDELLGVSDGRPAQSFQLAHTPAVEPDEGFVVESSFGGEELVWNKERDFARSGPSDRHFTFDPRSGEIAFGPAVRQPDADRPRQYGAVPPAGARLTLRRYLAGGGEGGNIGSGAINVLKSTVPFVARVENRAAGRGGRAEETIEEVKRRGPIDLRSLARAVTAEDYEYFARQAAPSLARVRCTPVDDEGLVKVVLIPRFQDTPAEPAPREALEPSGPVKAAVSREIERRRVIGARYSVLPARFRAVRVDALVRVLPGWDMVETEQRGMAALHEYFHPVTGGPDGTGWPFGRDVISGMAYVVLQGVAGVELVHELRLYEVDIDSGRRSEAIQRLEIEPDTVVVSRGHKVVALQEDL